MIVTSPRLDFHGSEARVAALVRSETGAFQPFEMIMGVPRAYAGFLDLSAAPFVPTLTLAACALGERLLLEGTVSPRLLDGAAKAVALFHSWWKHRPAVIEATPSVDARPIGSGAGLFFTRGVDSWFSALRNQAGEMPERLTHLLYAADLDRHYTPGNRSLALEKTVEAANLLGLPLVPVSHNGRELLDRILPWDDTHGGVLAGIGLLLGNVLSRVVIASTHDRDHLRPHGSHPDLDPLWSTEKTTIRIDGLETTRTNKIRALAQHPGALARLKVCWEKDLEGNCSRCRKCVRTMIALELAGALERTPSFDGTLTAETIDALPLSEGRGNGTLFRELFESFPDDHPRADLRSAIARRREMSSLRPRNWPAVDIEAAPGCAIGLVSKSILRMLPGSLSHRVGNPEQPPGVPRLEITWVRPAAGRVALPWRPTKAETFAVLDACWNRDVRPIPWCVIDRPLPCSAELVFRLTAAWGEGISFLPQQDAPQAESAAIQRRCEIRAWFGSPESLDPFRVLDALRHGCLPLQFVAAADHHALVASLPPGLAAFTLPLPEAGLLPLLSAAARASRLESGLSVVLAGSLERDLAEALQQFRGVAHEGMDRTPVSATRSAANGARAAS